MKVSVSIAGIGRRLGVRAMARAAAIAKERFDQQAWRDRIETLAPPRDEALNAVDSQSGSTP